jgi:aminoglycoside phosphotransferase (APT) family kinase protein
MQLPSPETVKAIVEHHHSTLHVEQIDRVDLSLIGQGYANLNVHVTVNRIQHFNLRIGFRHRKKAERKLQREFDALPLVPPGIGPRAFVLDVSRTYLPQPYSILEYLPGQVKAAWCDEDLEMHARTLAQLHRRKFDRHGKIGHLTDARFDIVHRFETELYYWQTHRPDLFDLGSAQRLLPAIRHFVADHSGLFADLRTFTIVHGDLHPLNILFHDDHLYYIDWQWAHIGDPAHDVAMIGWSAANSPGMELTGRRLDAFLDTYLMHNMDPTLRRRRDVWMVYSMFFDYLYFRGQASADSAGKPSFSAREIEAYLTERFSSSG